MENMSNLRRVVRALGGALLVAAALGCGPSPNDFPPDGHGDVLIASTEPGGGALAIDYDFDEPIPAFLSATLGGLALYSASDPGFDQLLEDEPDEGFFVVEDGVPVLLEITALDPGVQLQLGEVTLDEVGDSVLLGTTPEAHRHGEWQVVVPEGVTSGTFALSFALTTDAPAYGPSEPVTALLMLSAEEDDEHEDEANHEHEE